MSDAITRNDAASRYEVRVDAQPDMACALTALTSTSSHELCEAIADAVAGTGWYDDSNGEIGDICAWKTKTVAGYTVQQEWSNRANACVRPRPPSSVAYEPLSQG